MAIIRFEYHICDRTHREHQLAKLWSFKQLDLELLTMPMKNFNGFKSVVHVKLVAEKRV